MEDCGFVDTTYYNQNWIKTGEFKEIENVEEFIKDNELMFNNVEWINHNNFVILD